MVQKTTQNHYKAVIFGYHDLFVIQQPCAPIAVVAPDDSCLHF